MRTHTCGELTDSHVGQHVQLCGWVQSIRAASDTLLFVHLRDAYGSLQLLLEKSRMSEELFNEKKATLEQLAVDSLIAVNGIISKRPEGMAKGNSQACGIELFVSNISTLNVTEKLPFNPHIKANLPSEEIRLTHRHLDLRRTDLQHNIRTRSKATMAIRQFMDDNGFIDIETPILFKSTPEGAREFLVPTRVSLGACYALPQSPQQFKQMLMAAGFDRYFQIARCFRDEDLRADRQPEFTQVDMEMSFVSKNDIQCVMERLIQHVWRAVKCVDVQIPFKHLSFTEATNKYGSDKPDTRFGLEIAQTLWMCQEPHIVAEVLVIPNGANTISSRELTLLSELIRASKNNNESKPGDLVFVSERSTFVTPANTTLGRVRTAVAKILQAKGHLNIPNDQYNFLWIEDFPLFTRGEDDVLGKLSATHHPFTAPVAQDIPLLYSDPAKVHGQHYDLVLNGVELGGGSIRIHDAKLQSYIFESILKLDPMVQASFGHLITALGHGCPPHGGIALGLDRLIAILTNSQSLRDVIAFPKSANGRDIFMHSPAKAAAHQFAEYGLHIIE
ncbi:aspartate--tRNA ligase msd1 [Coemansia umbellata]|uniref:Aspartate--tRNA ligase msd1 n=1 Tax=Coemansia umbellata TaxID=1424467 RepID=A0ABQ8PRE0_9FUNG|nr:aspartate--tRNA ligase msd1 [Coemansia umbellata]